ncbi:2-C-methyl-D-erythritol 4-phosphate cytidylyltransferase [Heyndrickxia shackletonii]|uniref:2-C-methyl-D-erythritol 4-phosphate cytidylyltransferase n=1 Tax=Heyndrickxia shackletonii TaxID=157838 RepID=A0A0Q3WUY4_9BACI|nr:2-C-methyl-D-erythritol 4-phosphate cytidylyltransferase [Heyndrickxia shackletonii]KQL52098.1 2-C-methyl-D-erythritol 4-phosphate cytidylyltransferase [Heyndrickxia shackletonii]MBB2481163.1 2-C-methyl-D-erythritol 4-phosphate cytidylyltransferase [Bacillus sp. APMAM]NEZ01082.1 2-C-methyl-D-erythritol 4-phosphate cytidylyltransferase [Heyndrickxia shackletonii]RTZ55539.1 2-C-methyl-D-erythritol 4-phosphate cytidylyltransferase [Bacillus sp. SAJ1]
MEYQVIIPAAGQGKRMGAGKNKLFLHLNGKPIISHTLKVFLDDEKCSGIILAIQPDDEDFFKKLLNTYSTTKKIHLVFGGAERQYSVFNGLKVIKDSNIILVHDGARPFIRHEVIHQLAKAAHEKGAAIAAVPVKDTIKKVQDFQVVETIERTSLWQVQTPQAFRFSLLWEAHHQALQENFLGTDEASLVERLQYPVQIVTADYDNIKLTTPEDLYIAEAILKHRSLNK